MFWPLLNSVCMYVCLISWGPTEGQQTKLCLCMIHPVKTLLLREKQFLIKPPHAFASQLSNTVFFGYRVTYCMQRFSAMIRAHAWFREYSPDGQPRCPQSARSLSMKGSSHQPCLSATAAASPLPRPRTDRCSHLLLSRSPSSGKRAAPLAAGLAPALLMLHLCSVKHWHAQHNHNHAGANLTLLPAADQGTGIVLMLRL